MRLRTFEIVEVTAFYDAGDEAPVIPERHEGIDAGFQLSLDVIEAHFIFDAEGMPTIIDGRVRGLRLIEDGGELVHADNKVHWMDLDIGLIPQQLNELMGQMRAKAAERWKAIRGAK